MTNSLIIEGRLHAPYFIFLRCAGTFSDLELLHRLKLLNYQLTEVRNRRTRHVIIADDGEWVMLADDWYYTLWHMESTRPALAELAECCDVFACSVGDCDRSFDFVYYRGSRLLRKYIVTDPDFRGGVAVENVSDPLAGELTAFKQSDETDIVLSIAASLGIKTDYSDRDLRVYSPSEAKGRP